MAKQPKHKGKDAATASDCAVVSFNDIDEYAIARNQNHSSRPALLEDDELVRNKIEKEASQHLQNPSAQIRLSALRFIAAVLFGVGTVVGVMYVFLKGVTIKRGVADPIGSSKHADDEVEFYQTLSGYLTAGLGMIMEEYFAIFLAVMLTYFGNTKLYPSDKPHQGQTKMKRAMLFCMTPMIIYVVNIGLSSLFIQHTTSGVQRVFVKQDLVATTLAISSPWANATTGNAGGVENTILRSAVRKQVVPFEILSNSSCQITNTSDLSELLAASPAMMPVVKEIRSTAVVFGFPVQNWNHALFPNALTPTHSIKFTVNQLNGSDASTKKSVDDQFANFQESSGFDFLTGYEMFLQGKTLLERSVSDSNSSALYPCTLVDGRSQDDQPPGQTDHRRERRQRRRRRLQDSTETTDDEVVGDDDETSEDSDVEDEQTDFRVFVGGENDGKRVCAGAISSLPDLANMTDKSMHNLRAFANTIAKGMSTTLVQIAAEEIEVTLEKFALSDQINVTALSLDVPLAADVQYRDLLDYCTPEGELKASFLETLGVGDEGDSELSQSDLDDLKSMFCAQVFYPYDKPNSLCGSNNCVFLDKSELGVHLKKQLLLMPYLKDCSVQNLQYNNDFFNFLPSGCKPQQHAVFLYGLGSYMSGDEFDYGGDIGSVPYLTNPRRHITLSFAKLEWKLEDVSKAFNAKCGAPGGCDGLVLKLENITSPSSLTTQVLVLGNSSIPSSEILSKDFRNPVQLVTMNAPPFYYPQYDKYFEWEYLDKKRFNTTNWPQDNSNNNNANKSQSSGLNGSSCSVLIDSYISQVEANHYYLEEPLQALYTSAMFYLFQDAAVKQLTIPKDKSSVASTATTGSSLSFLGAVRFKGDRERKEIKFSIPFVSAVGTFAGLAALLLFTIVVLVFPKERLKNTHETNAAARLADVLTDDAYPPAVHTRKLVYSHESTETRGTPSRNGVDLDEYVVDTITFHHKRDPERKVYM